MTGDRFELDGRTVEVLEESLVTTYHGQTGASMQYTAVVVREVKREAEAPL